MNTTQTTIRVFPFRRVRLRIPGCGLLAGGMMWAVWLTGCTPPTPHIHTPPDTLVVALEAAPQTLHPFFATDATGVRISHQLLYRTLVGLGDHLEIIPGAARSWQKTTPTHYRFQMAPGERFSDGSPVEAQDAAATFHALMDPAQASPYGAMLRQKIRRVWASGPMTLEMELTAPYASLLADLILPVVSRKGLASPAPGPDEEIQPPEMRMPLGSGPFVLESWEPGHIVLKRSPRGGMDNPAKDAARKKADRPEKADRPKKGNPRGAARLEFKVVTDANTRLLKFRKGDVDLAVNAMPLEKIKLFTLAPLSAAYRVMEAPGLSYQYLGFNLTSKPLDDPRVRRAIAMAVNLPALIARRQAGHSTPATGLFPQTSPWSRPPGPQDPVFNPDEAARLLDNAGYPLREGERFRLEYKTTTDRSAVAQARAISADLARVGIHVEVRSFEWGTYYQDIQRGNFQLFSLRWIGVTDPDFLFDLYHSGQIPPVGKNRNRYRNPRVDRLLEAGRLEQNPVRRAAIYGQAQEILAADLPVVPMWHNNNIAVVNRRVHGFRLHPSGGFQYLPLAYKSPESPEKDSNNF
ncbi:MAG: ABC transporter substrate-binding protein [Deltaproteobacteria bacterium]|nr:ABC transporter substrate-binding protein [Deltaproteobacteria bacterium]